MEDLVNSIEDGECVEYGASKASDSASCGLGVESQIVVQNHNTAPTSAITSSVPNTWSEHGSVFTDSERLRSTKETADTLSEVLTNNQWDSVESMNRDTPNVSSSDNNWATFSPVSLSTSYHSTETPSWALEIVLENSSGEVPHVRSDNGSVEPQCVGETVTTSPAGWCAFPLGEDRDITTAASSTWPGITSSLSGPNTSCSMNSTIVSRSNEPCVNQTTPSTVPSSSSHHQSCDEAVFRQCFNNSQTNTSEGLKDISQDNKDTMCSSPVVITTTRCIGDWQCLKNDSFAWLLWKWSQTSLHHSPPLSCQSKLIRLVTGDDPMMIGDQNIVGHRIVPLGDDEKFDWTHPDRRRRSISPDIVPNLFRPRKESLVDVDFDHDRAASGLSVLSEAELQKMCDEMTEKFSRLSEELLADLKTRDTLAGEMEAKNRFVSALLRVQQLIHSQDLNGTTGGDGGRGRQWVWSQKKKDDDTPVMYLQTIIPYKIPDGLKWRTDTLTKLTKVLKAIADGSTTVPKLMSEYLQTEFLVSPVNDRHCSFDGSTISSNQKTLSHPDSNISSDISST